MIELLLLLAVVDKIFAIMPLTSTFIVAELVSEKSPERYEPPTEEDDEVEDNVNELEQLEFELLETPPPPLEEEEEEEEEDDDDEDDEDNTTDDADLALEASECAVEDA